MKKRYIICSPKYSGSNGIRVLHRLATELNDRGYDAYIFSEPVDGLNYKYVSKVTNKMRKNDIVVYPEIFVGNPLGFQNVVRYILFYPGKIAGEKCYDNYEVLFSFSKEFYKDADLLTLPGLDKTLFYYDGTKKDVDCYFVYKGGKWRDVPEFDNMIEINGGYPATRKELADLLRRTKTLYSYDHNSLLLDEALECGCKVKLVTKTGFIDYISDYYDAVKDYKKYIENFIEKTQAMDYKGKIRKDHLIKQLSGFTLNEGINFLKSKAMCLYYSNIPNHDKKAMRYWYRAQTLLNYKKNS